jgi:hypothetical protein
MVPPFMEGPVYHNRDKLNYGAGGVFYWVDPVYELVGVYFSVALESLDDTRWKGRHYLFMNAVTAAVVDV